MKRTLRWTLLLAAAGLCLTALLPAVSEAQKDKKKRAEATDEKQADDPKDRYITDLMLAYRLVEIGLQDEKKPAPEALIAAAGIMRRLAKVPLAPLESKVSVEDAKGGKEQKAAEVAKAPDLEAEAKDLMETARGQAAKLELNLDPLIKAVENRANTRDLVGGPRQISRSIGGGQTHVHHVEAIGQRPMRFAFHASIPLRLTVVRSDNDNPYGAGIVANAQTVFTPGPGKDGSNRFPVTIRIHNVTGRSENYQLFIN